MVDHTEIDDVWRRNERTANRLALVVRFARQLCMVSKESPEKSWISRVCQMCCI
jgi:hypothetical protein